jgi:uncharacterized protein (DUF2235 family)
MTKRIVICADGTWSRPENNLKQDIPTNVLRLARAIKPIGSDKVPQQVFYDWGIGSYHEKVRAGATGKGLHKNIMDDYRYIVQNYSPGDEIFLFGFSRGAYTIRSLVGLIHNCGIVKRPDARLIQAAFNLYKKSSKHYAPTGSKPVEFRKEHSHTSRDITFVGAWDTVGAMGIPFSVLGFLNDKDEFYDTTICSHVKCARHAMAIDEYREDFEPTVWHPRENVDMQQVWFLGAHSDIGGSYKPDKDGTLLSDITLGWMMQEASTAGLTIEAHLKKQLKPNSLAKLHKSSRSFYRIKQKYYRELAHGRGPVMIHHSVKQRWEQDSSYRPSNLQTFLDEHGWPESPVT